MDKDNLETNAKAFKHSLIKDIVYITAVFMNKKQSGGVSPLITRVYPMERGFINFNQSYELNRLKDKDFITPFQIVSAMVRDQATDFYSGIHLDVPKEFSKYADRWENTFGKQFQKDINSFRDTTIESILKQYHLSSNINDGTMRNIISKIAEILDKREASLKKMMESWYRQMRINMLMWEYQDNGYNSYMFIGKDGGCDDCSSLSGQIFLISDAKTGVNFPPMHINCRCHIGIVDDFGNLLFEIDGEKHDTNVIRTEKDNAEFDPRWLSYIPFFGYGYTLGEGIYALINEEMRNKFDSEDWQQRMMLSTFTFATIGEALVNAGFTGNESMSEIGKYIQNYMGNAWDYITGKFNDARSKGWYNTDGSMNYPPNNGAVPGTEKEITLKPGQTLGRYGEIGPKSDFATDIGASSNSLSLPPNTNPSLYTEIKILKPIPGVTQSTVAEWPMGSGTGGGIQYQLPMPLETLKDLKYIYY